MFMDETKRWYSLNAGDADSPSWAIPSHKRMHQFQRRTRHGMEANKLFWCVFITIKRDFQPPSVAGARRVVRWLPRLSPAATRLCYCEGQSRDTDIKKMHPTKVIAQSLDALLHGSWRESLCDVYISTSELRFFAWARVLYGRINESVDGSVMFHRNTKCPFFAFVYMYVCMFLLRIIVYFDYLFKLCCKDGYL